MKEARLGRIKCLYNEQTGEITGTSFLNKIHIMLFIWYVHFILQIGFVSITYKRD